MQVVKAVSVIEIPLLLAKASTAMKVSRAKGKQVSLQPIHHLHSLQSAIEAFGFSLDKFLPTTAAPQQLGPPALLNDDWLWMLADKEGSQIIS
jgi:hypothetical protein